ncbi:MAG: PP2C family protein-serine/threonine phosphatase [Nocardioidaceae bacterium]
MQQPAPVRGRTPRANDGRGEYWQSSGHRLCERLRRSRSVAGCGTAEGRGSAVSDWSSFSAARLFDAFPTPGLLLDLDWTVLAANAAYVSLTGRPREALVGRSLFDAFPDTDPGRTASQNVRRVLEAAVRTQKAAVLRAHRYDISPTGDPRDAQPRYWTTTSVPLIGAQGQAEAVLQLVHDVTALTQNAQASVTPGPVRARDLFRAAVEVTEQLRLFDDTVIAERQLGLAVQDAMLPTRLPAALAARVVVRYRPASNVLHVGGDWYDVSLLPDGRFALAVGDVVGHGLNAAVVMGQLRSALNALTLTDLDPAQALAGLDRFARQDDAAAVTTALRVTVDPEDHTLTYSSAGHPPAVLVHRDGTTILLEDANGPALALPIDPATRRNGHLPYPLGARLLLYPDGLVERRGEHLDVSLQHLSERLRTRRHLPLQAMADQLLADVPACHDDDVALLLVQL